MKLVFVAFVAAALVTLASSAAVMSVDVGTEWFKVAVVSPGVPMEIALNPSSKRKTNVVVSIEGNERKFGDDAMVVCVKKPKYCYAYLLDLLGKKVDHPTVAAYKARFPQYDIEADPIRGTVIFRHDSETTYSVEELLGMILSHAKSQAETFTEQPIKDAVITVPVFFNQVERLALVAAAQLGGLNVLQLMNNPMAVALNYGMFRRKEINGTVKHIMLYDMGAGATTATVIGFQIVKTKDRGFAETHPQAQVMGVGYDRTLGGAELRFRVREFLADKFNALGKTKTDVRTVPRAMGKLLKEAERVKLILSANTDCFAQIENVMEDIDFKEAFSREDLMGLAPDLMARVTKPVEQALSTAGMAMENIDQVILVGGGTRVPKVQELLTEFVGSELGKSLNTDESAAMGAVYKAADLSTGFKVKKFLTKDAVVFPIDVDFSRALEGEEGVKKVRRTLFGRMNPYPQKKIMTFNKHQSDFTFYVNYADMDYLGKAEVERVGSMNLTSVLVKGVKEALDKNLVGENIETKGVKAHFQLDDSGILSVSSVESTFEKTISPEEQEAEEAKEDGEKKDESIDWSKLGDTISNYFKSEGKEGEEDTDKEKAAKDFIKDTIEKDEKEKKAKEKKDEKKEKKEKKKDDKPKEPKKPKIETTKTDLDTEDSRMDLPLLDGDTFEASKAKLAALDKADKERVEKETALNELQSFNFDLGDKIYQEDHESASTEAERETIQAEVSKVSDWLDEEAGVETPLEEFTSRLKVLRDMAAPIFARVREHRERPEWLDNLKQSLNHSTTFLTQSREKTEKVVEEEKLFKEKELEQLEKKIAEVEKWRDEKLAAQADTPLSEMPKLTVSMINSKIGDLESEVQYLIRKAKMKKAELERARLKAEADAAKAEADKKKAEKKAKKKKAKEAKEGEEEKASSDEGESAPPTEAPPAGDGESIKDPSDEKPESEAEGVEEPVVGEEGESVDSKEDAQKDAEEHVEL
jgi:hypoxia up-regulated 1